MKHGTTFGEAVHELRREHGWSLRGLSVRADVCRCCGAALTGDERTADGCPCNSRRGINHGLVPAHVCT